MKAVVCKSYGPPENLSLENLDIPKPKPNEVLIKIAACSLNFPDTLLLEDKYQFKPGLPFIPGSEVSGTITEIGSEVKNFKVGDRVLAICGWGGLAEYISLKEESVILLPDTMGFSMGASLMYNYGTSLHALKDRAQLKPGETLLVMGASGGVGLAAIQLAKRMGAKVIAAASSAEKLEICKKYGADVLLNYTEGDFKAKLKDLNLKIDVIYDPVGGPYAEPAIRNMAWGGRYLVVGFAAGDIPKIPLNLTLLKSCSIIGVFWGAFVREEPLQHIKNTELLAQWHAEGSLPVHIHESYNLDEAQLALRQMMDRKIIGKALIKIYDYTEQNLVLPSKISKTVFNNKEEIISHVGKNLGTSSPITISQNMVSAFADATLDHQWIHIDPKKATLSPFKGTIVHGFFTLSLSVNLLEQIYEVKNSLMGINYGVDKVRFTKPVPTGSKIYMTADLVEAEDAANNGLKMKILAKYFTNDSEKPVCIAELLSIVYF